MDIASAITIGGKVFKMAKKAKKYFDLDQEKRIIILQDYVAGSFSKDCPDFECDDFQIKDRVMTIFATGARTPICDGASLAPDKVAGFDVVSSSVVHDCLYHYMSKLAHSWGWYEKQVRQLADEAFGCDLLAKAKAEKNTLKRIAYTGVAYIYYYAVRLFGGLYHNAKNASVFLCLLLFIGCSIPDTFVPSGEELQYIATNIVNRIEANGKPSVPASIDAVDYSLLKWKYGGFNGSGAKHQDGVIIANLSVHSSGMSYSWQSGNCEMLGASGHTNADCIACLFCYVDGEWRGGKFEWISTSRTTRSWHNLNGYNGWKFSDYERATEVCFVIVSKNGKARSNVIKVVK